MRHDTLMGLVAAVVGCAILIPLFNWIFNLFDRSTARMSNKEVAERGEQWKREDEKLENFYASAKVLRGKVISAMPDGMSNLLPHYQLTLRVEDADGPYEVTVEKTIDYMELDGFKQGSIVKVYVDPKDRQDVRVAALRDDEAEEV